MFKAVLLILSVATGNPVATLTSKADFVSMSDCQSWLAERATPEMLAELRDFARKQFAEPVNLKIRCEGKV